MRKPVAAAVAAAGLAIVGGTAYAVQGAGEQRDVVQLVEADVASEPTAEPTATETAAPVEPAPVVEPQPVVTAEPAPEETTVAPAPAPKPEPPAAKPAAPAPASDLAPPRPNEGGGDGVGGDAPTHPPVDDAGNSGPTP